MEMCVHTRTNLVAVGSWFPGLVHSALALALASIALALGVLAVQPVAGHSFPVCVGVRTHDHWFLCRVMGVLVSLLGSGSGTVSRGSAPQKYSF